MDKVLEKLQKIGETMVTKNDLDEKLLLLKDELIEKIEESKMEIIELVDKHKADKEDLQALEQRVSVIEKDLEIPSSQ